MKDLAGPPTWLLICVLAFWMYCLGIYVERNRPGGTHELRARLDHVRRELRRVRKERDERRRASMPQLVPPISDDVVVDISRGLRRHAIRNGHAS